MDDKFPRLSAILNALASGAGMTPEIRAMISAQARQAFGDKRDYWDVAEEERRFHEKQAADRAEKYPIDTSVSEILGAVGSAMVPLPGPKGVGPIINMAKKGKNVIDLDKKRKEKEEKRFFERLKNFLVEDFDIVKMEDDFEALGEKHYNRWNTVRPTEKIEFETGKKVNKKELDDYDKHQRYVEQALPELYAEGVEGAPYLRGEEGVLRQRDYYEPDYGIFKDKDTQAFSFDYHPRYEDYNFASDPHARADIYFQGGKPLLRLDKENLSKERIKDIHKMVGEKFGDFETPPPERINNLWTGTKLKSLDPIQHNYKKKEYDGFFDLTDPDDFKKLMDMVKK